MYRKLATTLYLGLSRYVGLSENWKSPVWFKHYLMLGMVIFWILFGLTLTVGSVARNCDLCLGALYNLCPQSFSAKSPVLCSRPMTTAEVSFFELKWGKYGGWRKNLKTARNYADFKKARRQERFFASRNIFHKWKFNTSITNTWLPYIRHCVSSYWLQIAKASVKVF